VDYEFGGLSKSVVEFSEVNQSEKINIGDNISRLSCVFTLMEYKFDEQ
jgi:hypothetical protein